MDLPAVCTLTGHRIIKSLAGHAENVTEGAVTNWHAYASTGITHGRAPGEAVSRLHGNCPHPAFADLLGNLGDDGDGVPVDLDVEFEGRVDLRELSLRELRIDHRSSDADDLAVGESGVGHDCSWLFQNL